MKLFINLLFSILFLQSCNSQSADDKKLKEIVVKDSTLIVDVRSAAEFAEGHVDSSVNIPLDIIADSVPSLRKYKNLIVVCKSGGRSTKAEKILKDNGLSNVYNARGWKSLEKIIEED